MDEKKGFAIPPKGKAEDSEETKDTAKKEAPIKETIRPNKKDEKEGAEFKRFIGTFDLDGEARNFVSVKTDADGNFVEVLDAKTLENYAKEVLKGGDDVDNLQIGEPFYGDDARERAEEEADQLNSEYDPGEDASNEELAIAAVMAAGAKLAEEMDKVASELDEETKSKKKPEGEGAPAGVGPAAPEAPAGGPMGGAPMGGPMGFGGSDEYNAENAKLGEALPEGEPMLEQLKKTAGGI